MWLIEERICFWGSSLRKGSVFMVDHLCDMGAFSKSIFTHVYIGFNISEPPGGKDLGLVMVNVFLLVLYL